MLVQSALDNNSRFGVCCACNCWGWKKGFDSPLLSPLKESWLLPVFLGEKVMSTDSDGTLSIGQKNMWKQLILKVTIRCLIIAVTFHLGLILSQTTFEIYEPAPLQGAQLCDRPSFIDGSVTEVNLPAPPSHMYRTLESSCVWTSKIIGVVSLLILLGCVQQWDVRLGIKSKP